MYQSAKYEYQPTEDEILAAKLARQLDPVIALLQKGTAPNMPELNHLINEIDCWFETVELWDSSYMAFLLQQCQRYNVFSLEYVFENDRPVSMNPFPMLPLPKIELPAKLASPAKIEVRVESDPSRFRPPYVSQKNRITRYFYRDSDVDTFIPLYKSANTEIFKSTQGSNVMAFFKSIVKNTKTILIRSAYDHDHNKFMGTDLEKRYQQSVKQKADFLQHVESGQRLNSHDLKYLAGENVFFQPLQTAKQQPSVTHIGHATSIYRAGRFTLVADPIHYQSGTDPSVRAFAAMLYDRQTEPAMATTRYPGVSVVWISHNHHDHLCPRTLKEAFAKNTLFIVPMGDKDLLNQWGFNNVIEIPDWDHSIVLNDPDNGESLTIHAIPARHASNRFASDINQSLYMGCLIEHSRSDGERSLTILTGDTAVWDEEHYEQLQAFIQRLSRPISLACVATGPDRPRQYMECTHQSSADAITFHARLLVANLMGELATTFANLKNRACQSVAYHQGCFRLGILSYNDASKTFARLISVLQTHMMLSNQAIKIDELVDALQYNYHEHNVHYAMMDQFERDGLRDLLKVLLAIDIIEEDVTRKLSLFELSDLLQSTFHLPKIGDSFNPQSYQACYPTSQLSKMLVDNHMVLFVLDSNYHGDQSIIDNIKSISNFFPGLKNTPAMNQLIKLIENDQRLLALNQAQERAEDPIEKYQQQQRLLCYIYNQSRGMQRFDEKLNNQPFFDILILSLAQNLMHPASHTNQHLFLQH